MPLNPTDPMQAQAKAHDVLRKASAAVSTLERRAADVAGTADSTPGTVTALKTQVSSIESCLEVCLSLVLPFLSG